MCGERLKIEDLKKFAQSKQGELLSKKYINQSTKYIWKCKNGHIWGARWKDIKNNHWCPFCYGNSKPNIMNLQQFAQQKGGQLLSDNYTNCMKKYTWKCKQGHIWKASWNHIKSSKSWCPECYGNIKPNIKKLRNHAKSLGGKLLSRKYINSQFNYEWECEKGHKWRANWNNVLDKRTWCPTCCKTQSSKAEREILEFVQSLGVNPIHRDKSALNGNEIDIYVPEKNVGIEYHGLYWHCSKNLDNFKMAHREKHLLAKKKGIQLIQFFEDEWRDKKDICKSMIKHRLGISENRIYARKCEIRQVETKDRKEFFNNTHIAGDARAKYAFGLYFKDELVECISFRLPYTRKQMENIEIARLACKQDTSVVGGFQKLLKFSLKFLRKECPDKKYLITYGDARFGFGNVYHKTGFEYEGFNSPGYFYTNINHENYIREFRFKHKRINDPEYREKWGFTEKEQNHNQGWFEVYDCGHYSFKMKL